MSRAWFIWKARNDVIFNSLPLSVHGVVVKIKVISFFVDEIQRQACGCC